MTYVLAMDTSALGVVECTLFLMAKKEIRCLAARRSMASDHRNSSIVLRTIDATLRSAGIPRRDLKSIRVVKGPGPFTAVRVGVVTANALGWALGIPVYGCTRDEMERGVWSRERGRKRRFRPVMPEYGAEPNITIGKKLGK